MTRELGELLRQFRAEAHLTQEELAARSGVAARTISDIETGVALRPRAITLSLVAAALGLDDERHAELRAASGRQAPAIRTDLPGAVDLVGRAAEFDAATALLRDDAVRLLTLVGGPGVGKSALAAAVARGLASGDGVRICYVDLGDVPDASLVPAKTALAFGVRGVSGISAASIAEKIADRRMLLVADNFERAAGAAPFVGELLAAAAHLRILVTSRRRIGLAAEHVMRVGWLPIESSIALLQLRIRESVPDFRLPRAGDAAFRALAEALGGMPLAIDLAAPLLPSSSVGELKSRLGHSLVALKSEFEAGYLQLERREQRLFRRLAVLGGRFSEEAVAYVAADEATTADSLQTLQAMAALLECSLLSAGNDSAGDVEFEFHPLIAAFAGELLERAGEREAAFLRLTAFCFHVANAPSDAEPHGAAATRRLERESSHFDAALGWLKATGRLEDALSLVCAVAPTWVQRGRGAHGYAWVTSLLADRALQTIPDALLADVHWAASGLAKASEQMDRADEHIAIALPLKRELGDRAAVASLLDGLGLSAQLKGEYATARTFYKQGLAIRRELSDGLLVARSLLDLGACAADEGAFADARRCFDEALALFQAVGRNTGISAVLGNLAVVELRAGSPSLCEQLARESIRIAEQICFPEVVNASEIVLSRALLALGDVDGAEALVRRVAAGRRPWQLGELARTLAAIAFAREQYRLAARLTGAASTDRIALPLAERASHDRFVGSLRTHLGTHFEAEYELGHRLGSHGPLAILELRE